MKVYVATNRDGYIQGVSATLEAAKQVFGEEGWYPTRMWPGGWVNGEGCMVRGFELEGYTPVYGRSEIEERVTNLRLDERVARIVAEILVGLGLEVEV